MRNEDPRVLALPACIRDIGEMLGYGIVTRIVDVIPGVRMYIPRSLDMGRESEPPTAAFYSLTPDDQKALVREFGGECFEVPTSLKSASWRDNEIRRLRVDGVPLTEIALAVGLSRRSVFYAFQRLGMRAARSGAAKQGSKPHAFVKAHAKKTAERHRQVRADYAAGMPISAIAAKAGCTTRTVRTILVRSGQWPAKRNWKGISSKTDAHLTPHAEGVRHPTSQNTRKPVSAA